VGRGISGNGSEAFRWTAADGMQGLGDLPGGAFNSWAHGVSADGAVIVGHGASDNGALEAFRWTAAGGMQPLGDFAGGGFDSRAFDVSDDGSVVVGTGVTDTGFAAFYWTEHGGLERLGDVLVRNGADLSGWLSLDTAWAVSGDGLTVAGVGYNAAGEMEAFRAVIPEPVGLPLLSAAVACIAVTTRAVGRRTKAPSRTV
jgi:probable HAF family extracellular repeat protein